MARVVLRTEKLLAKEIARSGHSMQMTRTIVLALLAALGGTARADRCETTVTVTGDAEVVRAIEALLRARGIEIGDGECASLRAHIERRGNSFAIGVDARETTIDRGTTIERPAIERRAIERPARAPIERHVGELATAATVIESFVRDDASVLLPVRARPARVQVELAAAKPVPEPTRATRGVQVFAAAETSIGSDHTNWMGMHLGVCIQLGPICAAARLRHAAVVAGEGMWRTEMERRSTELLLGLDVPFALGRTTLAPGFAAGMGSMWTRSDDGTTVGETGGLRADVHTTLSVPLTKRWALDLSVALDLTQETRIEAEHAMTIPDEPLALLRFGIGVRYGGL